MARRTVWLSILAGIGAFSMPHAAHPCGGFFEEETVVGTATVEQSALRTVFEMDETSVTAHVQIAYDGDAEGFAWVVPVASEPRDIQTTSADMFDELDRATAPRFVFVTSSGGGGGDDDSSSGCGCIGERAMADGAGDDDDGGDDREVSDVTVWSEQNVGPFDTAVISSDDADALRTWLVDHGYAIPAEAVPVLEAYVAIDSFFLAMQLSDEADVSQIEPIRFTFDELEPCMPLRLNAISSVPDLPIIVFLLSDVRGVPDSWQQAQVDFSAVRMIGADETNYPDLVAEAIDAAGGRAFVTEYASPTSQLSRYGIADPVLLDLMERHRYLTRLHATVSPGEMTVDPTFRVDEAAPDVSNYHEYYNGTLVGAAGITQPGRNGGSRFASVAGVGRPIQIGALLLALALLFVRRSRSGAARR